MEATHETDVLSSLAEANNAAEQLKSSTKKTDLELCVLLADIRRSTYDTVRRLHADQNAMSTAETRYVQKLRQKKLLLQQKRKQLAEISELQRQLDSSELDTLCRKYGIEFNKHSLSTNTSSDPAFNTELSAQIKNRREEVRQKAIAKESLELGIEKRKAQARKFQDQIAAPTATYNAWLKDLVSTSKRMHTFLQTQKSALLNPDKAEPERVQRSRTERRSRRNESARRDDRVRKRRFA